MSVACEVSSSGNIGTERISQQTFENHYLGHQPLFDGAEELVPVQEKVTQEPISLFLWVENNPWKTDSPSANYRITHRGEIVNLREVLSIQIYPSHFFW